MGGLESKFNGLLVEGRTEDAEKMWEENPDLQNRLRPNAQIKFSPTRDTPLHCTVRHEMKFLLTSFLAKGGDPFVRNLNGDTPLHLVCTSAKFSSRRSKRKAEQLMLLLNKVTESDLQSKATQSLKEPSSNHDKKPTNEGAQSLWASLMGGVSGGNKDEEKRRGLGVQNKARNTPLHLAAASGLLDCVELLLAHNAPLFVRNVAGQTPCDVAWEAKQLIIAKQLESKMVFASDPSGDDLEDESSSELKDRTRMNSFHDSRALRSLKKEIVENVSQHLQIAEFPAQALLMAYGWSEELVRDAWENDREGACEKAGIDVTMATAGELNGGDSPYTSLSLHMCGICDEEIPPMDRMRVPCDHHFCQDCWRAYLESQINEGAGREIRCPGYQCYKLVPEEVISTIVSADQLEKYTELNVKQFVESSSDIRWCPFPDCGYAICVRGKEGVANKDMPRTDEHDGAVGGVSVGSTPGVNVECGRGHGFCWHCMKEPHEPSSCELWENWKEIISRMTSDDEARKVESQAQADAKWIIKNTKPCPHCKAPIQKNEGCNHMTCKQCRHDFCWVCLDPWSLHNHRTGGYFTCNRFSAQEKARDVVSKARGDMEAAYVKKAAEDHRIHTKRFFHYHERYKNHLHSLDIEMKLLQESTGKMKELERLGRALDKKVAQVKGQTDGTVGDNSPLTQKKISVFTSGESTNFLDEIFRVLLRARRILSASYCIGYFIPDTDIEALEAHEGLQAKLEEAVEVVAEMVSRQYLLTPRSKMSEQARNVDYLCNEYLTEMSVVATIADLAVRKEKERPPPKQPSPVPSLEDEDELFPIPGGIPLGRGPEVEGVDGLRRFRLVGLLNQDGTLHILRVPEGEFPFLRPHPPGAEGEVPPLRLRPDIEEGMPAVRPRFRRQLS